MTDVERRLRELLNSMASGNVAIDFASARTAIAAGADCIAELQAEVAALTEENEQLSADVNGQMDRAVKAEAVIERVKALPEKWRKDYNDSGHDYELMSCESCADELEAALKEKS